MAKKGLMYALLSALLLSTMNLFVKMLGSNIPSGEIAFFRGLFGTIAVLIVMYTQGIRFSKEDRGYLIMRGLYGCLLYTSPSPRDSTSSRMPSSA